MELLTPVGRLVQGKFAMQQRKDSKTKQPLFNKDGTPDMGCFFSVAYPKLINGAPNAEWASMWADLVALGASAWAQFFPQGAQPVMPNGGCTNPKFSWKYQDGDGFDTNGNSVADKPGFKGHHILRFETNYPVRVFNEGKFAAHEEIQNPDELVKRGFWIWVGGEAKSNMANLQELQVPGISIYPKIVSFVERGEVIVSGPDAAEMAAKRSPGWRPPATDAPMGSPGGLPASPSTQLKPLTPPVTAAQPVYTIKPEIAAQGHTLETIQQQMTLDEAVAQGYVTKTIPTPAAPPPLAAPPKLAAPARLGPPPGHPITLTASGSAGGATIESLLGLGWTYDTLVTAGHATRNG